MRAFSNNWRLAILNIQKSSKVRKCGTDTTHIIAILGTMVADQRDHNFAQFGEAYFTVDLKAVETCDVSACRNCCYALTIADKIAWLCLHPLTHFLSLHRIPVAPLIPIVVSENSSGMDHGRRRILLLAPHDNARCSGLFRSPAFEQVFETWVANARCILHPYRWWVKWISSLSIIRKSAIVKRLSLRYIWCTTHNTRRHYNAALLPSFPSLSP